MNILSPRTSIFGQPNVLPSTKKQAQPPLPSTHFNGLSADTYTRSASSASHVQFAGHKDPKQFHNEQLYKQFNNNFQPVIQKAIDKATAIRDPHLTAEHLVWAAIQTLDDLAGWEVAPGRHSRASDRKDKEQAEMLAQALLPNHPNITPVKAAKMLRPLAEELARGFDHDMDVDGPDDGVNLGLQRALQTTMRNALKSEEEGVEPAPQALFRKILWQVPPAASFAAVSASARAIVQAHEPTPPVSPTDGMSSISGAESNTSSVKSATSWDDFASSLQEKSPGLAKWVNHSNRILNNPTYQNVKLAPLSHIVASGLELAQRELNPTGRRRPNELDKATPFKNSINSLIPELKESPKMDRNFINGILERNRKTLQNLPLPQNQDQAMEAAQRSRHVIEQFLNQPGRDDYSLEAFIDHLKDPYAASMLGAPKEHGLVGQVLKKMHAEAQDTRAPLMEQFEKTVPTVMKNGTNMVRQGLEKQLPEVLLRRQATDSMLAILNSGSARTNILLNAKSGEGKTYAVQGLAQRIADNDVPPALKGAQMVQLNLGALEGNTPFKGDIEGKIDDIFKQLNKYLSDNPNRKVILFVDEAHMLGDMMDTMKASGILEKKNLSFIGATTPDDWRKSALKSDQAFQGRFQELSLPSFNRNEKLTILGHNSIQMAKKNGVSIPPEILELALDQASSKWPENGLRRASDLLGLAVSLAKNSTLEQAALKDQLQHKELWLETLKAQKDLKGRFMRQMADTKNEVKSLNDQIDAMDIDVKAEETVPVEDKHVRQALAILTGERIGTISQSELDKLHRAKEIMGRDIIGQPEALTAIEQAVRKMAVHQKTGGARNRPITSMLLCGPTGVGKTEVCKVIGKEFMNNNFIRIDMSEYGEKHEIARLLGSPPGYVGHENGGLVDQIRKNPNSVIVFDEIEKAHPDVFNILLQILEEGELRDNQGQPVSFRNAIVALTSNLNNEQITKLITKSRQDTAKGKDPAMAARELETNVRKLLTENGSEKRKGFRPEQLGRIDYVIPFSPLTKRSVSEILDIRLREMNQEASLKNNNLTVTLSDKARARLIDLTAGHSKPKAPEPTNTNRANAHTRGAAAANKKKAEVSDENTMLPGGARDVRKTFERFVFDKVFSDLTFEPELSDVFNAELVVDYEPKTQAFKVKAKPVAVKQEPLSRTPSFMDVEHPGSRTLAFA